MWKVFGTFMTTNNKQVEEMMENIKSSLYQIQTRVLRDAPVYLQHVSIAELTLLQHFTHQLALKDEQHAKELELARVEAKIGILETVRNSSLQEIKDRLSELNTQKEKLLNERN